MALLEDEEAEVIADLIRGVVDQATFFCLAAPALVGFVAISVWWSKGKR